MIRTLLHNIHKRAPAPIFVPRYHHKIKPHEIAEAEEKEAYTHDWGNLSEKDTSFEEFNAKTSVSNIHRRGN